MKYRFSDETFSMNQVDGKSQEYDLSVSPAKGGFKFIRTQGCPWKLPPPAKCYGFPDQVRAYFQNASFLSDLELQLEKLFGRIFYLGPLREYPKRQYPWAGGRPLLQLNGKGRVALDAAGAGPLRQHHELAERLLWR